MEVTAGYLASIIDHTFLKPFGTDDDMVRLCDQARKYRFAMVAVNPTEVERCVQLLDGSGVRVGAAIGFPLGQNTTRTKVFETEDAISRGAGEIDFVINVRELQAGKHMGVRSEINRIVAVCRGHQVISKVILETCYLNDDEKRLVCDMALDAGADFVKTSTGFGSSGATVEDVRLMRSVVGDTCGVKASGGIRNLNNALAMMNAGATRIGTSRGVYIVQEALAQL